MYLNKIFSITIYAILALLPCYTFADNIVSEVGDGIANAATDVGNAVEGAAQATGKGVTNVFSDNNISVSDASINKNTKNTISNLRKDKKIGQDSDLSASTSKGVVLITGTVATEEDITTVKNAVKSEAGVKDVKVNIMVKGGE